MTWRDLRIEYSALFLGQLDEFGAEGCSKYKGDIAGIAQLVERNLAKVEVAGSNPVSRSKFSPKFWFRLLFKLGTLGIVKRPPADVGVLVLGCRILRLF